MKYLFLLVILGLAVTSCNNSKSKQAVEQSSTDYLEQVQMHKIMVVELIQTSNYTYLYVSEKQQSYWVAVSKAEINVGDELLYLSSSANEMVNFHSKELDRDFESILFISKFADETGSTSKSIIPNNAMHNEAHSGRKVEPAQEINPIGVVEGGISIKDLFANKAKYSAKKVKIKGTIVKVNNQIMGRNWVHLQDGTKFGEEYDLTFTTQEALNVGTIVTLEGIVALDKDFTSGYFYPVIIEDAKLISD